MDLSRRSLLKILAGAAVVLTTPVPEILFGDNDEDTVDPDVFNGINVKYLGRREVYKFKDRCATPVYTLDVWHLKKHTKDGRMYECFAEIDSDLVNLANGSPAYIKSELYAFAERIQEADRQRL